jgi:D-xylose transport system substrate-binding protein
MFKKIIGLLLVVLFFMSIGSGFVFADDDKVVIGLSIDNLRLERWPKDRDAIVAAAEKLGAEVLVQSANSDDSLQFSQCQNLLTQGIDVLIVIPHNGRVMGSIVEEAHEVGVPVIAYERLLMDCDLDYSISFDNRLIGELQAKTLVERKPYGNYVMMGGSPTDNNALIYRAAHEEVLQPFVDSGDIKIVNDEWAKDWLPQEGMKIVENALTANDNDITAVIASNDSTAQGAIQALEAQGLAEEVLVSGQDADVISCQLIAEGKQTMTVYKPMKKLGTEAAILAFCLAKGLDVSPNAYINNDYKDVPAQMIEPIAVTQENIYDVIIKDGWFTVEEVYKNVPKDQWPE